ncbi:hypothetical protein [Vibrio sp. LaRot3]|uniref:hypothetical protein n=1 Tax=Vibrio sp. LaRot3 TaxID=2998829 RepID=UPI0022CDBE97|nr:hypothetical protein [Vibrio sp. LaRot3]MDA0147703.1 hypothetical protein [Vibrio sp. LaRot3]
MFPQSKILVWYQVASQKVVLGEAFSSGNSDVHSIWRNAKRENQLDEEMGYGLSLFDDDGREVAGKVVSVATADNVLMGFTTKMNKVSL